MKVANNTLVGIDYTLTDDTGSVFETTVDSVPLYYTHGTGTMIAGIERATEGLQAGDSKRVLLTPSDGYGQRNSDRVFAIPAHSLDAVTGLRVGMRIQLNLGEKNALFTVMNKDSSNIVLDGNHPLAGLNLLVNIEIVSVRQATQAEISGQSPTISSLNSRPLFLSGQLQKAV